MTLIAAIVELEIEIKVLIVQTYLVTYNMQKY